MTGRVLRVFRCECSKAFRRPATYAGPFLVLVIVLALSLARYRESAPMSYAHIADASSAALNLGGLALAIAFGAMLIAPEVQSGTIRLLLVRPVRRAEVFLGKFLLGLAHVLMMLAVAYATAWVVVTMLGDVKGVTRGGGILYTQREMNMAFLYGGLMSIVPLAAATAYAMLVSALVRNGATAVLVALAGWLMLDVIKYPLGIEAGVFTTYVETPMQLFSQRAHGLESGWSSSVILAMAVCTVTLVVCLGTGIAIFQRKALRG